MRRLGNWLAFLGALAGVVAAILWSRASLTAADFNVDSLTDDLIAIGKANMRAAGATAVSAFLIAVGEAFRAISRFRSRY